MYAPLFPHAQRVWARGSVLLSFLPLRMTLGTVMKKKKLAGMVTKNLELIHPALQFL